MNRPDRCAWVSESSPLYCAYHDEEWGTPLYDEQRFFELFLLEAFQAGLSWLTILRKRENFRAAFDCFDAEKIARYDEQKIRSLLNDPGIIRSRGKIEGAIANAKIVLDIRREHGSFCGYIWSFTGGRVIVAEDNAVRCSSPLSDEISVALKKRGMRYVGSVTIYSFLQAAGIVNDHEQGCFRRAELLAAHEA